MRIFALFLIAAALCAQKFEVASIKVNSSGPSASQFPYLNHGRLTAKNSSVRWILEAAWDLGPPQITGPDWINNDRYDMEARAPDGVPDAEIKPMLQALLKDRFKLEAQYRDAGDAGLQTGGGEGRSKDQAVRPGTSRPAASTRARGLNACWRLRASSDCESTGWNSRSARD
jgi:uncharacterized protein (TIGR03435 family)